MNRKFIFVSIGIMILLSIFVIAQGVANRNKDLTFSKNQKEALDRIGLSDWEVKDITHGTEEIERCLFQVQEKEVSKGTKENGTILINVSVLNTCRKFNTFENVCSNMVNETCLNWTKQYLNESKMLAVLDDWEFKRLEGIADATLTREERDKNNKTIVGRGKTNAKSK